VLWGLYWGFLILIQRLLGWLGVTKWFPWIAKVAITFGVTCVGWLLFRERNLGKPLHDFAQSPFAATTEQWWVGAYLITLVFIDAAPLVIHLFATSDFARRRFAITWPNLGLLGEASVAALLLFGIVLARSITTSDFIYFQF
jgi:alginate O-acetyltransferase complex protein AlgI